MMPNSLYTKILNTTRLKFFSFISKKQRMKALKDLSLLNNIQDKFGIEKEVI